MSSLAIYIKCASDFLIINKEYHYVKPSSDYELQKCDDPNVVF